MSVVLLTFLGTGSYQPCRYSFPTAADPSDEVIYYSAALAGQSGSAAVPSAADIKRELLAVL